MFRHFEMPSHSNGDTQSTAAARTKDRTGRACERCRQMKIKCDQATTCSNCRSSFNDCVYTEPRRKRKASPHVDRLQELEKRVKAMEESYQALSTARDSPQSPNPSTQQQAYPLLTNGATAPRPQNRSNLHLDEGEARFGCSSADRAFIDRLKAELGDGPAADFDSRLRLRDRPGNRLFHPANQEPHFISLPPRERAEYLTNRALDSTVLYHVLHRPTFDSVFELLYSLDSSDYGIEEMRHIPLVYALMALGCLSEKTDDGLSENGNDIIVERSKYFVTCRGLVDLNDCTDIITLQAIFYMNLILLSTERLSLCYTYLTHAFSLAIRINLQQPNTRDDLITAEIKRRLFWSLRQLLMAVASMCGYPPPINSNEVDVEEPQDLDDTELKSARVSLSLQDPTVIRTMSGSVGLLKLHNILDRVVRELYPSRVVRRKLNSGPASHFVSSESIIGLENELQQWADKSLPRQFRIGQKRLEPHLEKAKHELWMTYLHVHIVLYRPFLHYFADNSEANGEVAYGFNKYASACVDASRNLIYLVEDMHRGGLFWGTQWRTAYMICTASLSLIYAIKRSKAPDTIRSFNIDLNRAKRMLKCLIPYSPHGRRIHVVLTVLIAAFTKAERGSLPQTPNNSAEPDSGGRTKTYTTSMTEQASENPSQEYPNYTGPGVVNETIFVPVLETTALQPSISHLPTTSTGSGLEDSHIQLSAPGSTAPITVPEDAIPQAPEPVTEAICPAAHESLPELGQLDLASYLEARPFNLQRPTGVDNYQLGREIWEFDDLTEDILNSDCLF
ncbi:fungal-specific transcription factor domain-containing protein [Aspergillus carlsbadensis]|nr:fungal-specific transcription factor domain-containing protein [Aspergillus carlsbadensis]